MSIARRRIEVEPADRRERLFHAVAAGGRNANGAGDIGDRFRRDALPLTGDRHRHHAAGEAGEIAQKAAGILGRQHADHQHQRARHPLFEIGERIRHRAAAIGIVTAVEPQLAARRNQLRQRPCANRCSRAGQSALTTPASNATVGSFSPATPRNAAMASPAFSN